MIIMRLATVTVTMWNMWSNHVFFQVLTPSVQVNGWASLGTFNSGSGQTYVNEKGRTIPFDRRFPPYCRLPYNRPYEGSNVGRYRCYSGINCVNLPFYEMSVKKLPNFMFFMTFFEQKTHTSQPCDKNHTHCHAGTPGVTIEDGNQCICVKHQCMYTTNPEVRSASVMLPFVCHPISEGEWQQAIVNVAIFGFEVRTVSGLQIPPTLSLIA
jgi:hypothetical protein